MRTSRGFFVIQDLVICLLCSMLLLSAAHSLRLVMKLQLKVQDFSQGIMLANSAEFGEEAKAEGNLHVEIINDLQTGSPYKEIRVTDKNEKLILNLFLAN